MMKRFLLIREGMSSEKPTLGTLEYPGDGEICKTGELPWKNNKKDISCIALGRYRVQYNSVKNDFEIYDVPNRKWVQIHIGNFLSDIKGCILVGLKWGTDESLVLDSEAAFNKLYDFVGDEEFEIVFTTKTHHIADQVRIDSFKGKWREATKNTKVSLAKVNDEEPTHRDDRHPVLKFITSKRVLGLAIAGLSTLARNVEPQFGELVKYIGTALASVGIIHAGYKSKPQYNSKAGWLYRLVDTIFSYIKKEKKYD